MSESNGEITESKGVKKETFAKYAPLQRKAREILDEAGIQRGEQFRKARGRIGRRFLEINLDKEEIEEQGQTDVLTGLNNRRGFEKGTEIAISRRRRITHDLVKEGKSEEIPEHGLVLIWLDVNKLKEVNDVQGHLAGDQLLRDVALSLREASRLTDVLSRFGGDEYAVLLTDTNLAKARTWWEKAERLFKERKISISGGAIELDQMSLEEALSLADKALYLAKKLSKEGGENLLLEYEEAVRISAETGTPLIGQHG